MRLTGAFFSSFRALVVPGPKLPASVETLSRDKLPKESTVKQSPGSCDTLVEVKYSNINYKDAMVVTGKYKGLSRPYTAGIDLVGVVKETSSSNFAKGQKVLLNGWGIGTDHDGGYAQEASVKSDWLLPLPTSLSEIDAARIGTAGYTSMLCVLALEKGGLMPNNGPVVVTGATGGVGSVAIAILSKLGYEVLALTGKKSEESYLKSIGASSLLIRSDYSAEKPTPLGKETFAGVVDAVGGVVVSNLLPLVKYNGGVACCGLASGPSLNTTVMPLILRGVSIHGIESVYAEKERRVEAYARLAQDLNLDTLKAIGRNEQIVGLGEVVEVAKKMMAGEVMGRFVVDVNK